MLSSEYKCQVANMNKCQVVNMNAIEYWMKNVNTRLLI